MPLQHCHPCQWCTVRRIAHVDHVEWCQLEETVAMSLALEPGRATTARLDHMSRQATGGLLQGGAPLHMRRAARFAS